MNIGLKIDNYENQKERWPIEGQHILAQYNDEYVVVYQAYRPAIGLFAAEHQYFGGEFSYTRMSWIKTNFLWMMYRSGWGTKEGQEVTLAIKLKASYFRAILENAVESRFQPDKFADMAIWKQHMYSSDVRLQWDPDHSPNGDKEVRRAVQLGLRGEFLTPFKGDGILEIEDISQFVSEQRELVLSGDYGNLYTPLESVYVPDSEKAIFNIGLTI
ncbi:DUF4291 domain-containing protein [Gallaecimonas pentaromativorans]|uniref:DUF4291 domain-containing protein n=1 Tax=Gallaecimonas pentaromativorans TaxID=584787 RepID=UPI003A93B0EA